VKEIGAIGMGPCVVLRTPRRNRRFPSTHVLG
jgi:hypothetical protein